MNLIHEYFPELTTEQLEKFSLLEKLYPEWNEKINVISRRDIDNLAVRHILHSLAIAKVIMFKKGSRIMDVGTGGGFPGIPLAIFFPNVQFYLIDSIGKKITVVQKIAEALDLKNVTAEQIRVEKVKQTFDFIVSRAVTEFPKFYSLTHRHISQTQKNSLRNGIFYLKGGDFDEEIAQFKQQMNLYTIETFFEESFFETKKIIHLWKKQ